MRYWAIVIGLAVGGWSFATHAPAVPDTVEDRVSAVAAGMAAITPKTLDHGVVMRSVHAEGRTLAVRFDGMSDWRPTYSDDEMTRMMGATVCAHAGIPKLIGDGGRLRMDMTAPNGWPLPSLVVDHCP